MAGGQAWGGGGKHQLSREGVAPREGGFARCMWPGGMGVGGWVGFPSSCPTLFFFFLNSSFGQTVASQSLRNKRVPNQDINTIGICTYLCLKERGGGPSWGGGGGRKAFGSRSRLWLWQIPSLGNLLWLCFRAAWNQIRLDNRKRYSISQVTATPGF